MIDQRIYNAGRKFQVGAVFRGYARDLARPETNLRARLFTFCFECTFYEVALAGCDVNGKWKLREQAQRIFRLSRKSGVIQFIYDIRIPQILDLILEPAGNLGVILIPTCNLEQEGFQEFK